MEVRTKDLTGLGFEALEKALEDKLKSMDPQFKRMVEQTPLTPEEKEAIDIEINDFLNDINKTDQTIRNPDDKNIFGNKSEDLQIKDIENKLMAEQERLKGNECIKSKDFEEAA